MSTEDLSSEHLQLIRVLAIRDPGAIAVAKAMLDEAQIEYDTRGEQLQNLGIPAFGPVEFWVSEQDAAVAAEILCELAAR